MKHLLLLIALSIFTNPLYAQDKKEIIIDVGQTKLVKKSLIALPSFLFFGNPATSPNYVEIGKTLFDVVKNDLDVSALFTFIDKNAYLEDPDRKGLKPITEEKNGFNFEPWKKIGTEFLVRAAYFLKKDSIEFEVYFYHVPTAKLIFGKKYNGAKNAVRTVAHTFCNDVIYNLTGKKGIYLTKLAVISDRGGKNHKELFTMDWDAFEGSVKKHTDIKSIAASPAWSPDAKKIAFSAFEQNRNTKARNHNLLLLDLVTGKMTTLSDQKGGYNSGPTFFPDGKSLLFTMSKNGEADIYRKYLGEDKTIRITRGPLSAMNVEANVSLDGRRIAFSSNRSGLAMIYVMDVNGTNVTRLTFAGNFNASPAFSPDGKLITFAGYDKDQDNYDIFLMNSNGENLIRLTGSQKRNSHRMASNEDPSFSPDGRHIVFSSDRTGTKQIYIVNLDGSDERRLTFDNNTYEKPRWSPYLD
jgi:TolB protein